jgi:hypothetical protein
MRLIKLTNDGPDKTCNVWVNPAEIVWIRKHSESVTLLCMTFGLKVYVQETPEEVCALISFNNK